MDSRTFTQCFRTLKGSAWCHGANPSPHLLFSHRPLKCNKDWRVFEDSSRLTSNLQTLTLAWELKQKDLYPVLTSYCTPEGKRKIWKESKKHADEFSRPNAHQLTIQVTLDQEPTDQNYNIHEGTQKYKMQIKSLTAWIKYCIKSVNYHKIREVTQGREQNPALFLNKLSEALRKFTHQDSSSPKDKPSLVGILLAGSFWHPWIISELSCWTLPSQFQQPRSGGRPPENEEKREGDLNDYACP